MKAILKKILFFLAYVLHPNRDSKVVYYHDVGKKYTEMGTDIDILKKHIEITRRSGFEIVQTINKRECQVMICFDDGWAGIYDVKDDLIRMNIFPTVFIAVDLIGKEGYLTKDKIIELKSLGFQFMAHTSSHQDLTIFDDDGLEQELKYSKDWLELTFGHSFYAICFPMGRFSKKVKVKSIEYGYSQLYTSIPGGYYDMKENNLICRNCAQKASPREFKWMLNGTSSLYRKKLIGQQVVDTYC